MSEMSRQINVGDVPSDHNRAPRDRPPENDHGSRGEQLELGDALAAHGGDLPSSGRWLAQVGDRVAQDEVAVPHDGFEARAGASGLAGSGTGGSAGSGSGSGGAAGRGGAPGSGGLGGSAGRDGARPLDRDSSSPALSATSVAGPQPSTTLRRGVQMENGSEQAPSDPAGSLVQATTAGLMVTVRS